MSRRWSMFVPDDSSLERSPDAEGGANFPELASGCGRLVRATRLNHVSISARDLEESARFYEELFGLERLPTPTFGNPVVWFRLGDGQLHLFQRGEHEAPRFHHLGLEVDDFEAFYLRLTELGIRDSDSLGADPRAAERRSADVPARPRRQPRRDRLAGRAHARPLDRHRPAQARRRSAPGGRRRTRIPLHRQPRANGLSLADGRPPRHARHERARVRVPARPGAGARRGRLARGRGNHGRAAGRAGHQPRGGRSSGGRGRGCPGRCGRPRRRDRDDGARRGRDRAAAARRGAARRDRGARRLGRVGARRRRRCARCRSACRS